MSKVVVTGGAGFIGSAIVPALQNRGHDVSVIDNLSFGNRNFIDVKDSQFFEIDIRDKDAIAKALDRIQPEWIIHLAAIHFIPYCNQHPFEASDINIRGTANLLDVAAGMDSVKKMFFASTAAVYPIYDEPINETLRPEPADIYGLSKLTGEYLFRKYHLETSTPTVICRFFNAFGPNETNPHLIPEIQDQINEGKRSIQLGNLDPKRDFIHTSDMASAACSLLERCEQGIDVFNLGRGIEYSVREIVEAFERALGESIQIEVDPSRVRKVDRLHLLADISKLKEFADWAPRVDIETGIKTLLR